MRPVQVRRGPGDGAQEAEDLGLVLRCLCNVATLVTVFFVAFAVGCSAWIAAGQIGAAAGSGPSPLFAGAGLGADPSLAGLSSLTESVPTRPSAAPPPGSGRRLQLSYGLVEARELCLQKPRRCTTFEDRNMHLRLTIKPAGFRGPHVPAVLTVMLLSSITLGCTAGGISLAYINGVDAAAAAPFCMAGLAVIPSWVVAVGLLHQSAIAMFQQTDLDLGPSDLVLRYSMGGVETARVEVSTDRLLGASVAMGGTVI